MSSNSNRLTYLDWTRGLAALVMLQGHVLEGWVRQQDRSSEWFWLSQFLGGLPAPIFLFLVGASLAIVLDRMRERGATHTDLAMRVLRRGAWVLFLAYLFRLEQYLVWYPASSWSDVFRVDTLNCIALTTLLVGLLSVVLRSRPANVAAMSGITAAVAFGTPLVYNRGQGIVPSFLLEYLNGGGHFSYFSLFPWVTFPLAGITFGYLLLHYRDRNEEARFFGGVVTAGLCSYALGGSMSLFPALEYGFFDYSVTSPHFFFVRLGWVLLILYGAYCWSVRSNAEAWSPLRAFGRTSLLVYWVHLEIVYGRLFNDNYRALDLMSAAAQLLWIIPAMLALSSLASSPRWSRMLQPARTLKPRFAEAGRG